MATGSPPPPLKEQSALSADSGSSSALDALRGSRKREESTLWESGEEYMRIKRRKLHKQFQDLDAPKVSSIFEGVTIYVNGWTQPNADELKEMIHAHGGSYEYNLYSNTQVTHTIATNLPNVKIKNIGKSIVVTPGWIVDSIAAGRCLSVDNYLLYKEKSGQQKLLFELKDEPVTNTPLKEEIGTSIGADDLPPIEASNSGNGEHSTSLMKAYSSSEGEQFVSSFFTHSRLHYLSTWSTELKQFTAKMLKQVTPRYPKLSTCESLRVKGQRAVVHIDLDCFFVSVSIRDKPHLKDKAVAVTHAKLPKGLLESESESKSSSNDSIPKHLLDSTSDIASCSYTAREAGVRNGMSVGKALKLCPDLILLPYDFAAYREVSQCFYEILLQYSSCVEAVSCDEAYIEFTDYVSDYEQVEEIVLNLRREIETKVGCTVSAGIAHNMLLARMCTRIAKPNGQFFLPIVNTANFLESQSVNHLPGVGYSTTGKLKEMNIETCVQLRNVSLEKLQEAFGQKTGKVLHDFSQGIDDRELKTESERKSVSVDINYGIRFKDISEAESLIDNLAKELEKRAIDAEVLGGTVSLKMKIRKATASKETWKYLGHGPCDNVTRSLTLLQPTRTAGEVSRLGVRLLKQVRVVASDIRGMGLQLSRLVSASSEGQGSSMGMDLRAFMKPNVEAEARTKSACVNESGSSSITPIIKPQPQTTMSNFFKGATVSAPPPPKEKTSIDLPPLSQLDNSVFDALPESLRDEILQGYADKASKPDKGRSSTDMRSQYDDKFKTKMIVPSVTFSGDNHVASIEEQIDKIEPLGVVIKNEAEFVKEMRAYIKDWILHHIEGPPERDVSIFKEYLLKLSVGNLDMMSQALKTMRRLISRLELISWYPVFNVLLTSVGEKVEQKYNAHLQIQPFTQ